MGSTTFEKVELRVAKVKACEPIKRAKKLLKLTLDDGEGERVVASGIAAWYKPEDLIGRKRDFGGKPQAGYALRRGKPGHDLGRGRERGRASG